MKLALVFAAALVIAGPVWLRADTEPPAADATDAQPAAPAVAEAEPVPTPAPAAQSWDTEVSLT